MKSNYLAFIGFGLVFVIMTAASGSYLYAALADMFFIAAVIAYRRQKRAAGK